MLLRLIILFASCQALTGWADEPDPASFRIDGNAGSGQLIYRTYCLTCHGETGAGDGPSGKRLRPRPYDLSNVTNMAGGTDWTIYMAIKEGGQRVGKSVLMTSWKGLLSEQDIQDVAAYVRTLAAPEAERE